MLDKRHLTSRLHVLTLLNPQLLYNNVRTCSRGFMGCFVNFLGDFWEEIVFLKGFVKIRGTKKIKNIMKFYN